MTPDVREQIIPVTRAAGSPPWDPAPCPGAWRTAILALADAIDAELENEPAATAIKQVQ